jgi:hypothetical protein
LGSRDVEAIADVDVGGGPDSKVDAAEAAGAYAVERWDSTVAAVVAPAAEQQGCPDLLVVYHPLFLERARGCQRLDDSSVQNEGEVADLF